MAPRLLHGDILMIDTFQRTASPTGFFMFHDGLGSVIKQIDPIPNPTPVKLHIFPTTRPIVPMTGQLKRCILLATWYGLPAICIQ